MKKVSLIILFLTGFNAMAQIAYVNTLEEAKTVAVNENKTIMIVFTGSDWSVPCMRLEKEILSQPGFKNYASKNLVLLTADFPSRSKNKKLISKEQQVYNSKLFDKYNPKSIFPLVVLLNSQGNIIAETGYKEMTSEDYASYIDNLIGSNKAKQKL
jgi:thioredoxin-related protein